MFGKQCQIFSLKTLGLLLGFPWCKLFTFVLWENFLKKKSYPKLPLQIRVVFGMDFIAEIYYMTGLDENHGITHNTTVGGDIVSY